MRARLLAENPTQIEFTLKLTATAKEWDDLRDQLENRWPSSELSWAITDLLAKAKNVFYAAERPEQNEPPLSEIIHER